MTRRPLRVPVACLTAATLCLAAPAASAQPPGHVMPSLEVPGGIAGLHRLLGLNPDTSRAWTLLSAVRVLHEVPPGVNAAADTRRKRVIAYLASVDGHPRSAAMRQAEANPPPADPARAQPGPTGDTVPLPLPEQAWNRIIGPRSDGPTSLFGRILTDRRAALLYYGLCAVDEPTRAYLVAHPNVLAALADPKRAPVMALYGRSLHIEQDRLVVPGGVVALPIWEALTGVPPSDPGRFLPRLLEKDGGRLALFYDTIAHLEPGQQAFALGWSAGQPGASLDRVRALYLAWGVALAAWDPVARPFDRVAYDGAHVLLLTKVDESGQPGAPASTRLWTAVFGQQILPANPGAAMVTWPDSSAMDSAFLVEQLCVSNLVTRRDRAEAWFFAQRVFGSSGPADLPDLLVALGGFARYRTLILALERIGIRRPATYAQAVRIADRLTKNRGPDEFGVMIAQFQGVVALIERSRISRTLDLPAAERLLLSLFDVPTPGGDYLGRLGPWLDREFMPAIGSVGVPPELARVSTPLEDRVLAAMTGLAPRAETGAALASVAWEGLRYRVDPSLGEFRRLLTIRARQGGRSLDAALAFSRALPRIWTLSRPDEIPEIAAVLDAAAEVAQSDVVASADAIGSAPRVGLVTSAAVEQLRRLGSEIESRQIEAIARSLARVADYCLADVLLSMAYAPHLGEADGAALLGGDPARHHDFGLRDVRPWIRVETVWRLPEESRDKQAGWRLSGSILGLELTLARLALRRLASETMPDAPALKETERQPFAEIAASINPADLSDAACDRLVAAMARGRAIWKDMAARPERVAATREGRPELDEWRVTLLPWVLHAEPGRASRWLSLGEIVRLGTAGHGDLSQWDAWGTSGWSLFGGAGPVFATSRLWTSLAGRRATRMVGALVPDLTLALAESLARLKLPAALLRGVLAAATQDFIDRLRVNHDDDWLTLVATAQFVRDERVTDYVASLTTGGALVPARQEAADARR